MSSFVAAVVSVSVFSLFARAVCGSGMVAGVGWAGAAALPHGGAVGALYAFGWWFCHGEMDGLERWLYVEFKIAHCAATVKSDGRKFCRDLLALLSR